MNANVLMFQTPDDGEIEFTDGQPTTSGGVETMAYLCLFGGNLDDSGLDGDPHNWWGNLDEQRPELRYRSETQNLLETLPANSGNLNRLRDAAKRDLASMVAAGVATSVEAEVTLPALNTVRFAIEVIADGSRIALEFVENWKVSQ